MVAVKSVPILLAVLALLAVGAPAQSTGNKPAPNNGIGTCGSQKGGAACADSTHCCSRFGFCGVGFDSLNKIDYCGDGCQGGPCRDGFKKLNGAPAGSNSATGSKSAGSVASAPAVAVAVVGAAAPFVAFRLN